MLIPVRCFTCGKVIADGKWNVYRRRVAEGLDPSLVLNELNLKRYCCRRMYISHYDAVSRLDRYDQTFPDDELDRERRRQNRKRPREPVADSPLETVPLVAES